MVPKLATQEHQAWLVGLHRGLPAAFDFARVSTSDDACSMIRALPNRDRGKAAVGLSRCTSLRANTIYRGLMAAWDHDHDEVLAAFGSDREFADALRRVAPPLKLKRETRRLYRGVTSAHAAYGISWTTDRNVACWFAMRRYSEVDDSSPWVFVLDVPCDHIITKHDARSEKEVLVHPDCFWEESVDVLIDDGSRRPCDDIENGEKTPHSAIDDWLVGCDRNQAAINAANAARIARYASRGQ